MKTSDNGIQLIKRFEGLRLTAYKAVSTEKFYTIGYGHYGADVSRETIITKDEADTLLKKDLKKFENAVTALNRTWTQNQFDALVSFAFNCGTANLKRLVANRDELQIADAFLLYNKAGGKVLSGLVRRRKAERALFSKNNDLEHIAREVIDGKWGNGRVRKDKLTKAGYNYHEVQMIVNRILTGE
jgi:GH24 family phage-related lysozyme (muramidase)